MANQTPALTDADVGLGVYSDKDVGIGGEGKYAGPLSNVPGESTMSGFAKGAATAGIKGVAGVPGAIGDIKDLRDYLGARLYGAISGGKPEEALSALSQWREEHPILSRIVEGPVSLFPSTEKIAAPILEKTGEYRPESIAGKAALAGAQTAVTGALTGGIGSVGSALQAGRTGAGLAAPVLSGAARALPGAAVSGAGAETATELTGEPLIGLAAGLGLPEAARGAVGAARKYVRPGVAGVSETAAKNLAAEEFLKGTSDPEAAIARLASEPRELVPGSPATTAQLTLDPGQAALQKRLETASPEFKSQLQGVLGERNVAFREAEAGLAPPGSNIMSPAQAIRQRVDAVEAATEQRISDLQRQAEELHATLPEGVAPEVVGAALRDAILEAKSKAKTAIDEAYSVVPDDRSAVSTPISDSAKDILRSIGPYAKKLDRTTAGIFNTAQSLPDVINFKNMREFDTRVTDAMRAAKQNPEMANEYRLLTQLKGSIVDAIDNAVVHQQKYVPPPGSGIVPNLTPEDAAALARAKSLYADYASTYKAGPVAEALKTLGGVDDFKTFASGLPNKVFQGNKTGYETARAFLSAGDNQPAAVAAMRDIANNSLRDAVQKAGGVLSQGTLNAWQNKFREPLRALDEVDPGYSKRFNNVASATEALSSARSEAALARSNNLIVPVKNLLNASSEDAVVGHVGDMIRSKNGAANINDVISATGGDPAAIEGLRRAGARWLINATANAGIEGGVPVVSGAQLRNIIAQRSDALGALFGKDGMDTLRAMAADMERAQAVESLKKVGGGSDTASNIMSQLRANAGKYADKSITGIMFLTALNNWNTGSLTSALASSGIAGVKALGDVLRSRGMSRVNDIIEDALIHPEIASELLQRAKSNKNADISKQLESVARRIARVGSVGGQQAPEATQNEQRLGRKSGGSVSICDELVAAVDRAKNEINNKTKSLLNVHDDHITHALEIANRHLEG